MSIVFRCLNCRAPLGFAEDQAGQRYHCPRCGVAVEVPSASAPDAEQIAAGEPPHWPATPSLPMLPNPAEQVTDRPTVSPSSRPVSPSTRSWEEDDETRLARRLDWLDTRPDVALIRDPHAWRLVRLGLRLHYNGIVAALLIVLCAFGFSLCMLSTAVRHGQFLEVLAIGFLGSIGVSLLVACVGQCLCCAAPPDSGVKGYAIGAAICLLITVTTTILVYVLPIFFLQEIFGRHAGWEGVALVFLMLALLMFGSFVTGHILFIVFLRVSCRSFRNYTIAESAGNYLIVYGIFVGTYFLQFIGAQFARYDWYGVFVCLGFAQLILGLLLVIWYLRLVKLTRETLDFWTSGA